MEKHFPFDKSTPVPLQELVDALVINTLPIADSMESEVMNAVGRGIFIDAGNKRLVGLIDELIAIVVRNSRRGDILIHAEEANGNLVLYVEERSNYNGYALSSSIGSLSSDAGRVGGQIEIRDSQKLHTTISLLLPCKTAA